MTLIVKDVFKEVGNIMAILKRLFTSSPLFLSLLFFPSISWGIVSLSKICTVTSPTYVTLKFPKITRPSNDMADGTELGRASTISNMACNNSFYLTGAKAMLTRSGNNRPTMPDKWKSYPVKAPGIGLVWRSRVNGEHWVTMSANRLNNYNNGISFPFPFLEGTRNHTIETEFILIKNGKVDPDNAHVSLPSPIGVAVVPWSFLGDFYRQNLLELTFTPFFMVSRTCKLSQSNFVHDMGKVQGSVFQGPGSVAKQSLLKIGLSGCTPGTKVYMTMDSSLKNARYAGTLDLDNNPGSAKGVGIQVHHGGAPITFGLKQLVDTVPDGSNFLINLQASYIQTQPRITGGRVSSALTFSLAYE